MFPNNLRSSLLSWSIQHETTQNMVRSNDQVNMIQHKIWYVLVINKTWLYYMSLKMNMYFLNLSVLLRTNQIQNNKSRNMFPNNFRLSFLPWSRQHDTTQNMICSTGQDNMIQHKTRSVLVVYKNTLNKPDNLLVIRMTC